MGSCGGRPCYPAPKTRQTYSFDPALPKTPPPFCPFGAPLASSAPPASLATLHPAARLSFGEALRQMVGAARDESALPQVAEQLARALQGLDLPVDRLQLPMSFLFGFKHPFYAGMVLTWTAGGGSSAMFRERSPNMVESSMEQIRQSPFGVVLIDGRPSVRLRRGEEAWGRFALMRQLDEQGFTDYLALGLLLPDGARQVLSVATRQPAGFPEGTEARLAELESLLALSLYGIYQSVAAHQIAVTYLGRHTAERVLGGEFDRGSSSTIPAVIAFADVRDFAALSERLGGVAVVTLVNQAFEVLDQTVQPVGGEILKLIGDAALIIFPRDDSADQRGEGASTPCSAIIRALLRAVVEIEAIGARQGLPLSIGVGVHLGEVVYGNIGSRGRLDFTVMGPAVNLTSRLEAMTKEVGFPIVVSQAFAAACRSTPLDPTAPDGGLGMEVADLGALALRGVSRPVEAWGVRPRPPV